MIGKRCPMPNLAPAGTSLTRTVPRSYWLRKDDFGFSDGDGNAFKALFITTLPQRRHALLRFDGALAFCLRLPAWTR
jgi:hypothetical protein